MVWVYGFCHSELFPNFQCWTMKISNWHVHTTLDHVRLSGISVLVMVIPFRQGRGRTLLWGLARPADCQIPIRARLLAGRLAMCHQSRGRHRTAAISQVKKIFQLHLFLVAKATLEMAGHGHWVCNKVCHTVTHIIIVPIGNFGQVFSFFFIYFPINSYSIKWFFTPPKGCKRDTH